MVLWALLVFGVGVAAALVAPRPPTRGVKIRRAAAVTTTTVAEGVSVGCVVTASPKEFDHFMRQAAVLVVRHGETGTVGVNLDSPTQLTIGEATEGLKLGVLSTNLLFSGGDLGGRTTLMIHAVADVAGATPLGDSGLYVGGIDDAVLRVSRGLNDADDFKFVFNYAKWGPGELDRHVDDDRWHAFAVPPPLVLRQDLTYHKGDLWNELRLSL